MVVYSRKVETVGIGGVCIRNIPSNSTEFGDHPGGKVGTTTPTLLYLLSIKFVFLM